MDDNTIGKGTILNTELPRSTGLSRAVLRDNEADTHGTETVLVVEDERTVRALTSRVLRSQGYNVLEARDGAEALQIVIHRTDPPIQLILTDMIMPGLDGLELAEQALLAYPGIKIVFTSGYMDDTLIRPEIYGANVGFLPKPFSLSALEHTVREALDGCASNQKLATALS